MFFNIVYAVDFPGRIRVEQGSKVQVVEATEIVPFECVVAAVSPYLLRAPLQATSALNWT